VTKLSAAELAAIAARAERATAGPWALSEKDSPDDPAWVDGQGFCDLVQVFDGTNGAVGTTWKWNENTPQHLTNARFIAAARTDIPALLGHARELQVAIEWQHKLMRDEIAETARARDAAVAKLAAVSAQRSEAEEAWLNFQTFGQGGADYAQSQMIAKLRTQEERAEAAEAKLTAAEAERDAYRKAKQENDERFMIERDAARQERDEARAALLRIRNAAEAAEAAESPRELLETLRYVAAQVIGGNRGE
jgi:hypothetical protein